MATNVKCETTTKEDADANANGSEAKLAVDASQPASKQMSKRALKRKARAEHFKELKKQRKAGSKIPTAREDAGYNADVFDKASYYFENGLRKVYPYHFEFSTYAKGRWVGRTLKNVLEKEFGFDQPEDVDKAFDQGKIHVNDVQVSADYVLRDCDYISHQLHRHENPVTDCPLEIIADTDDVVVINKPSSIPCHPCGRYRFNSVVFILGKEMGYTNLRNIYRLDRLTSGVLVMGKTAEVTKKLEDQVVNRQVQKEYVCRVMGEFPIETLTVEQPLQALSNKLRLQVVTPKGKSSQTTFTRLSYNGRSSVVKCLPHTGRTHQIRVHLQYLGHPIINDAFYNSDAWGPNKGKGGVYEVPNDIVCATILARHKAAQWEGGENPLFFKKLEEMKQQREQKSTELKQEKSLAVSETQSREENSPTTDFVQKMDTDTNSPAADSIQGQSLVVSEMMPREDKNSFRNDTVEGDNLSTSDTVKGDNLSTSDTIKGDNLSTSDTVNEKSDIDSKDIVSVKDSSPDNSFPKETQGRVGFDWTKWQVESSCDLCRKVMLEPRPRDLVMLLHALKYKGPDWAYQTELPDWAHEDWQDEDLYMLDQTTHQTLADGDRSTGDSHSV